MNEELREKLLNDINKSGFPLELSVIEKLREHQLLTYPNMSYKDLSDKTHEIDAFATMANEERESEWPFGLIGLAMFIECKSASERPWVFFRESFDPLALMGLVGRLACSTDIGVQDSHFMLVGCNNSSLGKHHYNDCDAPVARTYLEAFGNNAGKQIYDAITSVWYALDFHKRFFAESRSRMTEAKRKRTVIVHGVIVVKGVLVVADKSGDNFDLTEVPHVMLRTTDCITSNKLPFGNDRETVIDIVREDHFEQYLCMCRNDLEVFADHLLQVADAGWLGPDMKISSSFNPD